MKKLLLILIALPMIGFSQQWQQLYDLPGYDYGREAHQTSDGGYIIISNCDYQCNGNPTRLIKTDINGNSIWEQTFTLQQVASVQQTNDGGYILTGNHNSDITLLKTDATGNLQWQQTFGGSAAESALSVKQTSDGGYIMSGNTSSFGAGSSDFYLVKTDATGNLQWDQTFGGIDYETNYYVEQTSDGGFILTGDTYSGATNYDFYLVKTDATGNLQWQQTFGGSNLDVAREAHQTNDGGYILSGYTESYGPGDRSAYLVKTDALGNMQWDQTFGGINGDYFLSGNQTTDGGYILSGYTASFGLSNDHLYLVKTDISGNLEWQQIFGDTIGQSWGESVIQTNDGGFAICGWTGSYTSENATWLVKTDSLGNHIPFWWNFPGCTDSTAFNYDPIAVIDDSSCIAVTYGCTNSLTLNYNPLANTDDGSCCYDVSVFVQLGTELFDFVQDQTGRSTSISDNGDIIAYSSWVNGGMGGNVRIFQNINDEWIQLGQDISNLTFASGNNFGSAISLSADGQRIAIATDMSNAGGSWSNLTGKVQIFEWNQSSWLQIGQDLIGDATHDQFGFSVSFSDDGNKLAIGAPENDANGGGAGQVKVFDWNGSQWVQLGNNIEGQDENLTGGWATNGQYMGAGYAVSFSGDGNKLAVLHRNGYNSNSYVKVFELSGQTWTPVANRMDFSGYHKVVDLDIDGNTVIIGQGENNNNSSVKVFEFDGSNWNQKGSNLFSNDNTLFGFQVSITDDGNKIAISLPEEQNRFAYAGYMNSGCFYQRYGAVDIYDWDGSSWARTDSINGDIVYAELGDAMAMNADGSKVIVGARDSEYYGTGNERGFVRVYEKGNVISSCNNNSSVIYGCTELNALNYNVSANTDDGSCCYDVSVFVQLGTELFDFVQDQTGRSTSISDNGDIIAYSSWVNGGMGGNVRIFQNINDEWIQLGQDISNLTFASGNNFGSAISLSADGQRIAIATDMSNAGGSWSNLTGKVQIFEWNQSSWLQIGQDLIGDATHDQFGFSVSFSDDGNKLAIGAPENDANGGGAGQVKVFDWNGSQWVQLGNNIEGQDENLTGGWATNGQYMGAGYAVSFSGDGNKLAVLHRNGYNSNSYVKVFELSGQTWTPVANRMDFSGYHKVVDLDIDGNTVIIGQGENNNNSSVKVFEFDGSNWNQKGSNLFSNDNTLFGFQVSITDDGNKIAISLPEEQNRFAYAGYMNSGCFYQRYGAVDIYDWDGSSWARTDSINGDIVYAELGDAMAMNADGSKVIVGARDSEYYGTGNERGFVRVYGPSTVCSFGCTDTLAINYDQNANADDSSCIYILYGCMDSLACNYNSLANISDSNCNYPVHNLLTQYICMGDSLLVAGSVYLSSGIYSDTVLANNGCDSIITTILHVSDLSISMSQTPSSCSNWTDGSVSVTVTGGIPPFYYSWSTGDNTAQVDQLGMGTYVVSVTDSGCVLTDSIVVQLDVAAADSMHPEICYVSVDNTGFNRVVLRALENPLTAGYIILREYSANLYSPLDTLDGNTLSYIDSTSNPAAQAERYKVTAIDACGNSTDTSGYHKTVHLTMSLGVSGEVNLIWNSYEGYQVTDYLIYRGNSYSNMNMIGSISGTNSSFTDLTPPTGVLQYQIRAFAQNCASIPNAFTLPDTLESNVIDHTNTGTNTLTVSISSQNPSNASATDGFAVATATNGTNPYTYMWSNGVSGSFNFSLSVGTYTVFVSDADGNVSTASVTLSASSTSISGCTDPLANNYDPLATVDDGTCTYPTTCTKPVPTGLYVDNIIHSQAQVHWDNMSDPLCMALKYFIQVREVGTTSWTNKLASDAGLCNFGLPTTSKMFTQLASNTTYEYRMKAAYCNTTGISGWTALHTFTTADDCPNVTNFTATPGPQTNKVVFSWDTTASYSFVRVKLRVDSISAPTGSDWFSAGGFGVNYPALSVNKWGVVPGETYRGQARTWCNPNAGLYRSAAWTPLVFWTQPTTIRLEENSTILDLSIFPNPSRDIFNVSFTSEDAQDLKVRILNVIGEELINENLEQFIGEYTKQIDLTNNAKGIYFLEIETNDGIINKKLILQ